MSRKILFFFIWIIVFIPELVHAESEYFTIDYFEEQDIYVYSPRVTEKNVLYPVLYLIHGMSQDASLWEQLGLSAVLDSLYASNEIIPFFIVLLHDEAYMIDMYESDFYNNFLMDIMPFVSDNFPVDPDPKNTGIGGISRGAQWAQFFAFGEYGRFANVGVHSPANSFFSFPKIYRIIQDHPDVPYLRIRIDIGNNDGYLFSGSEFSQQLSDLFYPHEFVIGEGGHDVEYWSKYLPEYIKWYSDGFTLKEPV